MNENSLVVLSVPSFICSDEILFYSIVNNRTKMRNETRLQSVPIQSFLSVLVYLFAIISLNMISIIVFQQ